MSECWFVVHRDEQIIRVAQALALLRQAQDQDDPPDLVIAGEFGFHLLPDIDHSPVRSRFPQPILW
jgi:hypothetical protein